MTQFGSHLAEILLMLSIILTFVCMTFNSWNVGFFASFHPKTLFFSQLFKNDVLGGLGLGIVVLFERAVIT